MLAQYHSSLNDRVLSLSLKTVKKCQTINDPLLYIRSILRHIKTTCNNEERKRVLSKMKTEIEHTVQSTDLKVLQEYCHTVYNNNSSLYLFGEDTFLFFLIVYHVLAASESENSTQILNFVKDKLGKLRPYDFQLRLDFIFQLYLDVYYKNNPKEVFTNIHNWECDKATDYNLKLVYCTHLIEAKAYKTLFQLIYHHADKLIECFEENEDQQYNRSTATMVLLHILHQQVSINKMEKVKIIQIILSRKSMSYKCHKSHFLFRGFSDFILTLDNKQLRCTPYVIKLLQPVMKEHPLDYLKIILVSRDRLRHINHYTECIKFIKCHYQFISSFPTEKLKIQGECYYRQQYCITLLLLLHEYASCNDNPKLNLVLTKLLELRVSFLSEVRLNSCYCFMGDHKCSTKRKEKVHGSILHRVPKHEFQFKLLYCYQTRLHSIKSKNHLPCMEKGLWNSHKGHVDELNYFISVMNKVIQGELELAPYLQSIIDIMSNNMYEDESVSFFFEFIERSANKNKESLYNIVKTLCAFNLQSEVQDLILQGLNASLMISCKRQYGILSKLILDISMICPKGQFLYKMTSGIAKSFFKFDDNAVKDFNNIIYKCYCTVRHKCRNEKETNIANYKDHFTFIASMEAEEEMKKLTALTNFLLMLTLLLIASGGHHKSAELKKYLSLKYEYRDSILYLLWCSGDVEINPGPTLSTLRKVPDSVKERNWLYEMCSILLRLLKYRSIDLKNAGLWKEKPLHWPTVWPFYDPRNKPKGQGYNTRTDKKLMECLEEHCHNEGLFNNTSIFDEKQAKSKVRQYKVEIIAWKNNRTELFELYTLRQELDTLRAAKKSLHPYKNERELHQGISDLNVDLIFDTDDVTSISSEGYTDIVRDIAVTFCRIGKGLSPLEKSDGMWKAPPSGWNPNHSYFSPCNSGKRKEKGQYQKLVDNLLTYCESKNVTIPAELQPLLKAWKQRNTSEITKYYIIWSKTAIVKHSLKYLELEGLLGKVHAQESLKQIGVILDTQHCRCPSVNISCISDNDDKSQDPGFSDNLPSSSNSAAKIASIQINSDNPSTQLSNSTQTNTNDTPASPHSLVCHTDQQHHRNQSSKHTCVNSFKDRSPILTSKEQPEADGNPQPISSVNSSTWKGEVIPCTVHIHDATSKTDSNNKIPKTAKKRGKQKNDESPSEPKQLHISEEDVPLLLNILTSPSKNGMVLTNTRQKNCSKDGDIRTISPNLFPHDLISIQSRLNSSAVKNQTDQLVVKDLTDSASDKPEDSSIYNRKDGEINKANKNKTISDKYVDKIVDLLEELNQDYSSTLVEETIPMACSSTDQSEDSSNELPEPIKLCVDTYLNSYNPNDTLETDIEQFIEEQGMDSS